PSMAALLDALDADPGQRWRRAGAVAGVTALAGVAVFALWRGGEGAAPCGDAEAQLRTIWDPAQKAAVRKVFMASSRPFAAAAFAEVERSLDDYARAWAVMNTEACEATAVHKVQSEELLDLRMQCLGERKDELRAQVEVLASADATVIEHAAQAAHALPPVSQCADIEALRAPVRPPADPAIQTRVGAMRRELATVKALLASGRYADGLTRATALAGQAAEVGYRPFQAEALFDLGQLQEVTGDYAAAAKALREAGIAAEAGRHDQMAARAWIQLVWVIGPRLGKTEDAELLAKEAAAKLERFGKDDLMRADLDRTLGQMASDQGKWEQALGYTRQALALRQKALPPHDTAIALAESDVADALVQEGRHDDALDAYRRALADMEAALGPDHPMLISTLTNLATALRAKARYDEAGAMFDRAQTIALRTYGPDHPALATIFMDRGGVERAQGKLDAAVAHYQRALAIWEKALGPDNASVGTPHYYLGVVALQQDRFDDALVEFRRALDIWQKALGPDHPSLSAALDGIGDALMAKGQPREALAQFERGVLLLEKAEGPTHPDLAGGLTGQGRALIALHQARRATPLLERAHEILVANPGDPIDLARTEFALARALVDADGDAAVQTRARGLAEHARAAYAANPGARREAEAVVAWQATHP
ncbi:MAG: tetratricopeptide repeat protein, partial [Deltaproteobacteria bacterium]|nr:tetratricopeptide repeat protein [Deltaproteobacteria bacterium]